jgi:pimeloyl-ACP methyl ester carboxylesterase
VNTGPPGEFVTVGGDRLHVVAEGSGTPPVLLSAGLGGAWFDWIPVIECLQARAIAFDRPGLGGSPPSRRTSLRAEADRLAGLARWAGAPVIVVAHSLAGFHAEAFARRYPDLVHGLVLVDPSTEPDEPRHARHLNRLAVPSRLAGRIAGLTGVPKLAGPRIRRYVLGRLTEQGDVTPDALAQAVYTRSHVLGTMLVELAGYRQAAADLLALRRTHPFPAVPLCVITALGDARDRDAWENAHADLAAMSPYGRQIVLPGTGHLVATDRPHVVAEAVRGL